MPQVSALSPLSALATVLAQPHRRPPPDSAARRRPGAVEATPPLLRLWVGSPARVGRAGYGPV
jgi:hypothetical protein